jgi:hypothetical protein
MPHAGAQPPPTRIGFSTGRNAIPPPSYHPGGGVGGHGSNGNIQGPTPGYGGTFATSSGTPYTNSLGVSNMGTSSVTSMGNSNNPNQLAYGQHPSQQTTPTHSPYASSPSSSAYVSTGKANTPAQLRRYILLPPPKQRKLHRNSDLGKRQQ